MALRHNILHRDGTTKIYQSPATPGQFLYFTNRGDDIENGLIGQGTPLHISNPDGEETKTVEIQFLENIELKDAYIFWENAKWGDYLNAEVVLPANTPFEKSDSKGNAGVDANGTISYITASQAPDETWTGTHVLFPIDVPLVRFVNNFHIFGTNNIGTIFESSGVSLIHKDLKLRLTYGRCPDMDPTPNTDIQISITIEIFRVNTI